MDEQVTTAKLKEDLATVLRDAEALIKASAEHGGEKTAEARARIRESLFAAIWLGQDARGASEEYARQNPWQAMGIAAGVGLILGVLLARR